MQELRVIGVEDGSLVVLADDGSRYRLPIDDSLRNAVRPQAAESVSRKLAPKDIQAHIRTGMSAEDVASLTGAPLDYIKRFEGPVLDERDFVIRSALEVAVHTAADIDPMRQGRAFGAAITERLHDLGATQERWASWKEPATGWIVKLSFTANQIDHDARWLFDPRKHSLVPVNSEAIALSQQGEATGLLIPRLRAVAPHEQSAGAARFDSGAFAPVDAPDDAVAEPVNIERTRGTAAVTSQTALPQPGNQTADLLDALRRRRGEREAANFDDVEARSSHPSTGSIRIVDIPMPDVVDEPPVPAARATAPQPGARGARKGRAAMPSWDEIVFGARADDDPA
jgi:hypothetical protein